MTVTEFALLHLRHPLSASTPSRLLPTLATAMRLQDQWHLTHFPHLPSSAADRAAVWFTQVEDPSYLLTTANWESVAAHWKWIRSAENKRVMAELDGEVISGETVLLHVVGDIFCSSPSRSKSEPETIPLLRSPVISIQRTFIEKREKEAFAVRFEQIKGIVQEHAHPFLMRYGWREDVEDDAEEEEFVLVCGWESVEEHSACAETWESSKYSELRELVARVDLKHYTRLSLE
ncbi:hypothetical protein N657DRAFT_688001 [Parathielavia appendiculata]|uniref:ABM domain-containing protein n=1 Tax=Parathielavia appendiculata TaxID=2587402 RepID=A0AAN6U7B3_9PEZI|nr:hypothetical protein N657DRAFT_688001 [Parathielavia appendiculata]